MHLIFLLGGIDILLIFTAIGVFLDGRSDQKRRKSSRPYYPLANAQSMSALPSASNEEIHAFLESNLG